MSPQSHHHREDRRVPRAGGEARAPTLRMRRWIAALLIGGQVLAPTAALGQIQRSTAPPSSVVDSKGPSPIPPRATSDRRLALVIGNNNYKNAPLLNPVNDARLVAKTLQGLNFEVVLLENLNLRDFKAAVRRFVTRMESEDGTALLYYAGHGVQIEGRNYLLPIDVATGDEYEVRDESLDLEETLMSRLSKSRKRERIIILDACRDNPFKAAKQANRSIANRGFAQMGSDEKGTLIVYSTSPGHTAEDGAGKNSIFTEHFTSEIQKEGVEVGQALRTVFNQVNTATKGRQTPWYNSSLLGDFYFRPVNTKAEEERRRKELQAQVEAAVKAAKDDAKRDEAGRIEAAIAAKVAEQERLRQEREKQYMSQIAEMKAMLERREKDLESARLQVASAAKNKDEQLAALAAAEAERKRIEREAATVQAAMTAQQKKEAEAAEAARRQADVERLAKERREREAAAAAISAERTRLIRMEAEHRAADEKAAKDEADRQAKAQAELAKREAAAKAAQQKAERDARALADAQKKQAERDQLAKVEAERKVAAQAKREEAARLAAVNTEKLKALEEQARQNAEKQRSAEALAQKQQEESAAGTTVTAAARAADLKVKKAKEDAERATREAEAQARLAKIEEDVRRKAAYELEMLNRKATLPPELAALMITGREKVVVTGSTDYYVRGIKLPADVAVKTPASNVPPACAAFAGAWGNGRWNGERSAEVWVESVDEGCRAKAIYARGGLAMSGEPASYQRGDARIRGNTLTLELGPVTIELSRDGDRADGKWSSGVNSATAKFVRIPAEPERPVTMFANEGADFGARPSRVISASQISTNERSRIETMLPLPTAVPGVDTMTTLELDAFLKKNPDAVLIDTFVGGTHRTLPGAVWMPDLGQVNLGQKERSQIEAALTQANGGDPSRPIVVFERSSTYGWFGYHAVLRLLGMGYTNIYWYRGGLDAWHDAQFALVPAAAWNRAR
jgi:PQQ-dependent catabolism-associated CXXCW motif protein